MAENQLRKKFRCIDFIIEVKPIKIDIVRKSDSNVSGYELRLVVYGADFYYEFILSPKYSFSKSAKS